MKNIIILAGLLFRESTREPGWLFWSLFFPFILITAIYLQNNMNIHASLFPIFLSFVCVVTAIRGTGAYLLGRRESGFLKAFASFSMAKRRYFIAQCLSGFIFSSIVTIVFGTLLIFYFDGLYFYDVLIDILRACIVSLIVGLSSSVINLIPLKFQTIYSAMAASFAPMLLLTMAQQSQLYDNKILVLINYINPVSIAHTLISKGFYNDLKLVFATFLIAAIAFFITIKYFKIETYWDK